MILCKETNSWWKEIVIPGPYGQPMSEWGAKGPTSWGDLMKYTEEAGGAWMWSERIFVGTAAVASVTALSLMALEVAGISNIGSAEIGWKGSELTLTRPGANTPDWRFNPFGSRDSSNPYGKRPHYHRRPGIDKHRPWERGF